MRREEGGREEAREGGKEGGRERGKEHYSNWHGTVYTCTCILENSARTYSTCTM